MSTGPPRAADALLTRALPPGPKGLSILADLHQEFTYVESTRGRAAAARWYWREALALAARYGWGRAVRLAHTREGRGRETMSSLMADVKFGFRMLGKNPGLSLVAILTIAIGVGLTTHTYSAVYGTVLRGLPVPDREQMVVVYETDPENGVTQGSVPYADFLDLAARDNGLRGLAGYYQGTVNVAGDDGPPERYAGAFVTAGIFDLVGVRPLLGRAFLQGEDAPEAEPVILLSHHVWARRFAADPNIVGATVRVNGRTAEVVGVMPEGFRFPFLEDVWVPIGYDPVPGERRSQYLDVVGRIPDGSDLGTVNERLAAVAADLSTTYPEDNAGVGFTASPFEERYMPSAITAVLFLMLAATFGVLMIACANVANLLLARASTRSREVAIRTAMGASRSRVLRQMLAETLVVAVIGGALGALVAWGGVGLFNRAILDIEKPYWIDIRMDGRALAFALAASVVAALAAGLVPALRASGIGLGEVLRDEGRGSSSLRLGRFSSALVVTELAVSCGLLVAAGLMIKSVANLQSLDLGFEPARVLTGRVGLFEADYPARQERRSFFRELETRLEALPGVEAGGLATSLPGLGSSRWAISVEGETYATPRDHPIVNGNVVTSGFFDALGMPLLQGVDFAPGQDWDDSDPVAVVNQSFVRTVLGGRDPLGLRVRVGRDDSASPYARIIGVVPDTHVGGGVGGIGDDRIDPEHLFVTPGYIDARFMSAVLRMRGTPAESAPLLRRTVTDMDPNLPVYQLGSLSDAIQQSTWAFGLFGSLFTIFGIAALFLAAVGLYGVMAFSVNQRRHEMGVRMALGAAPGSIMRLVLRKGVVQLGIGMTLGLGIGYAMAKPLSVVTFGVSLGDPTVYAAIVLTLGAAGLLATVLPARSATRADPVDAMRT